MPQLLAGVGFSIRHYLPCVGQTGRRSDLSASVIRPHFQLPGCHGGGWHGIRIMPARGIAHEPEQGKMEPIRAETVAPGTVASLRGGGRSTPVWWEAFDGEGSWRVRILRNPRPRPCRVGGVSQMSDRTTPWALSLVPRDAASRDFVSHSFAFFTGLCEKDRAAAPSLALLTGRHK